MKKLKGTLYSPTETVDNYNDGDREILPPGVYICAITFIKDEPNKEYLYVEYDICEGQYKDYYKKAADSLGWWMGKTYWSYKSTAMNMFQSPLKAINISNGHFIFNPFEDGENSDESTLIGKKVAIALREEEYQKADGSIGVKLVPAKYMNIEKAKSGIDFSKLLKKKTLKAPASNSVSMTEDFMKVPDTELGAIPF